MTKSKVPLTALFTDQALEQEFNDSKRHGGIVDLSEDDTGLDRLVTHMMKQFLSDFPRFSQSSMRCEHYQPYGDIALRIVKNALKLRHSIEKHCASNPFADKTPLKNLGSSALVQEKAKGDILYYAEIGEKRFQEFVQERLLNTSKVSAWDSMKKIKLKAFSKLMEKTKVLVGQKVIKLREERELFGRFLIILQSRPQLVPKLEDTIGDFEISVAPHSLCTVNGSLNVPEDKASLMHGTEEVKPPSDESLSLGT